LAQLRFYAKLEFIGVRAGHETYAQFMRGIGANRHCGKRGS
jgi:hypothetical protein